MRRYRSLLIVVAGSLVSAGLGYAAALTMAPSRGSGDVAPPTGPVTAAVELRRLGSSVITRGDAAFSDPVELVVRTQLSLPIVTRAPKPRGATIAAGEVALEVAGRPVIVLTGTLPAYRDLTIGDVGPDVTQLELSLSALGLDPGEVDDELTSSTAAAVDELYERLGYAPASEAAPSGEAAASEDGPPGAGAGGAVLPMSEVSYVSNLPRRVDRAPARRGRQLPKVPMLLSGSELVVSLSLTTADTEVLKQGMRAEIKVPGGRVIRGRLGAVTTTATGGRTTLRLPDLTSAQVEALQGSNVKVTVPLEATDGKVLVVPLAALSTDAAGTARVARVTSSGETETVEVELGLAAEGYVEVRALDDALVAGDRVVVGA